MAIPPVLVEFAVSGLQDVGRAFDTVEQRIVRMEQGATRATETGTKTRIRAAETEAKERDRLEKYKEQVHQRSSAMAGRFAEQQANTEIRQARRTADEMDRIRRRSSEMAGRLAAQQANEEIREAKRAADAIERTHQRIQRGIGGAAARGVSSSLSGIGGMASGALAIGGGFALADIAHKQAAAEKTAGLIVNEVTINGKAAAGATVANILGRTSQVAQDTGMSKNEVQAGLLAYTRSAKGGDFGTAMENIGFFAKLAKTTGSDISEIATGAGMLQSENPNLKAPEMRAMLLDMMAQGHAGSIPLNEMVGLAGIVGSARGTFAGSSTDNQRKLLGLTQLGRSEAGGPEEAARGLKQMALEIQKPKKAALLKSWNVHFNEHGQVESPEQMIAAAIGATGGNLIQLGQVFGTRSGGIMRHLAETFRTGGGGAKGIAAVQEEMASVTKATTSPGDLEAQFQQLMSTPAEKFEQAVVRIQETIANRLEPWMGRAADKLQELVPDIENVVSKGAELAAWFAANPFQGLGVIVAGAMTKELASAGMAKIIEIALTTKLGGGLSIATATFGIGMAIINLLSEREASRQRQAVRETNEGVNAASNLLAGARAGTVTPTDIRAAQQQAGALQEKLAAQREAAKGPGFWSTNVLNLLTRDDDRKNAQAEVKATETALQQLQKAINAATSGLSHMAETAKTADPARSQPIGSPGRS